MPSLNWSIRAKLLAISVTMLTLIVGMGALNYSRLYLVNQTASDIRDRWLPATRDLAEVARATEQVRMILALELLATSEPERANDDLLLADTLTDRARAWNAYVSADLSPEQRRLADRIDERWRGFLSKSDEMLVEMQAGDHDDAYALFLSSNPLFADLRLATADGLRFNVDGAARASERAGAEYGMARIWIGGALVLGLLVCGAAVAIAVFGVSRPILRMADTMKRLAGRDLSAEIDGVGRNGEIGEMANALVVFKTNAVQLRDAHAALEDANAMLETRIEERTFELKSAQDELLKKERLSVIGQITATVAHELRNPLSAIRNSAFILKEMAAKEGARLERPVQRIERSVERCDRIVAELLDYTRSTAPQRETCPIDAWLRDLAADLPHPPGGRVALELDAAGAWVSIDPERFRRVAINLVENAVQAMTEAGNETRPSHMVIRTRAFDDMVELAFEDNGPGIPAEHLAKVFEPLFSTKRFGTGLGLPTVRQIVEQHDGTIEIKSVVGEGTLALIRLPLTRMSVAA